MEPDYSLSWFQLALEILQWMVALSTKLDVSANSAEVKAASQRCHHRLQPKGAEMACELGNDDVRYHEHTFASVTFR